MEKRIFDKSEVPDEPFVRSIFFPVDVFDSSPRSNITTTPEKSGSHPLSKIKLQHKNRSRIVEELNASRRKKLISLNISYQGDARINLRKINQPIEVPHPQLEYKEKVPALSCFHEYKKGASKILNRSKYDKLGKSTIRGIAWEDTGFTSLKKPTSIVDCDPIRIPNLAAIPHHSNNRTTSNKNRTISTKDFKSSKVEEITIHKPSTTQENIIKEVHEN